MSSINYQSKITNYNGSPKANNENPANNGHNNVELISEIKFLSRH